MTSFRIAQILAVLLSTVMLAGCSTVMEASSESAATRVAYTCDRGAPIAVVFYPSEGRAELLRNDNVITLESVPVGSGFKYSNVQTTIRGKGDEMILEVGRMAPITCKAM